MKFAVSLPGLPKSVVNASSSEEAFEKYRDRMGVVKTTRTPVIEPVTDPAVPQVPLNQGAKR